MTPPPTGPVSLLTMWTNRITAANSRKHQEFAGRVNSINNKFELYQQLKEENGCVGTRTPTSPPHRTRRRLSFVFMLFIQNGRSRKRQGLQMMAPPTRIRPGRRRWNV